MSTRRQAAAALLLKKTAFCKHQEDILVITLWLANVGWMWTFFCRISRADSLKLLVPVGEMYSRSWCFNPCTRRRTVFLKWAVWRGVDGSHCIILLRKYQHGVVRARWLETAVKYWAPIHLSLQTVRGAAAFSPFSSQICFLDVSPGCTFKLTQVHVRNAAPHDVSNVFACVIISKNTIFCRY